MQWTKRKWTVTLIEFLFTASSPNNRTLRGHKYLVVFLLVFWGFCRWGSGSAIPRGELSAGPGWGQTGAAFLWPTASNKEKKWQIFHKSLLYKVFDAKNPNVISIVIHKNLLGVSQLSKIYNMGDIHHILSGKQVIKT